MSKNEIPKILDVFFHLFFIYLYKLVVIGSVIGAMVCSLIILACSPSYSLLRTSSPLGSI